MGQIIINLHFVFGKYLALVVDAAAAATHYQ